jgi:hypothetical protein
MPPRAEDMSRGANERQVFCNIDRAREEAALATSPQGLTVLAKGFWYRNEEEKKRRNKRCN